MNIRDELKRAFVVLTVPTAFFLSSCAAPNSFNNPYNAAPPFNMGGYSGQQYMPSDQQYGQPQESFAFSVYQDGQTPNITSFTEDNVEGTVSIMTVFHHNNLPAAGFRFSVTITRGYYDTFDSQARKIDNLLTRNHPAFADLPRAQRRNFSRAMLGYMILAAHEQTSAGSVPPNDDNLFKYDGVPFMLVDDEYLYDRYLGRRVGSPQELRRLTLERLAVELGQLPPYALAALSTDPSKTTELALRCDGKKAVGGLIAGGQFASSRHLIADGRKLSIFQANTMA